MRKSLTLLVALLLLFPIMAAAVSVNQADTWVKSYLQFVELRKPANPDMDEIQKHYQTKLLPLVKEASRIIPKLRAEVEWYLAQAEKNKAKSPYLQGVEKNLQFAFVQLMNQQLDLAEKNYQVKSGLSKCKLAKAYYGGIDSTAKRRGEMLGSPNALSDQFNYAFGMMEKAITAQDLKNVTLAKNQLVLLTTKVYFLGVLYELDGIAANRGKNEVVVQEKVVEGKIFFKVIKSAARDTAAAAKIEAEFNKAGADLNIALVKENLQLAYPELAKEFKSKF